MGAMNILFLINLLFVGDSVAQVLIYCNQNKGKQPEKKLGLKIEGGQAYVVMWNLRSMFSRNHGGVCDCIIKRRRII